MTMDTLPVGTPVWVKRRGQPLAQGEIAHVGKVHFSNDTDWVGIRLVGASTGQGRHNGSVEGVAYFASPPLCGLFVRHEAVTRRTTIATASPGKNNSSRMIHNKKLRVVSPPTPISSSRQHLKTPLYTTPRSPRGITTPVGLTINILTEPEPNKVAMDAPPILLQEENKTEHEDTHLFLQNNLDQDDIAVTGDTSSTPFQPFRILQNTESPEEEIDFDDRTGISTIESASMHRLNLEAMFERNGVRLPPTPQQKSEKRLVEERKMALEQWRNQRQQRKSTTNRLPRVLESSPPEGTSSRPRKVGESTRRSKSLAPISVAARRRATTASPTQQKEEKRSTSLTPTRTKRVALSSKSQQTASDIKKTLPKQQTLTIKKSPRPTPSVPSNKDLTRPNSHATSLDKESKITTQLKRARLRAAKLQAKMEHEHSLSKAETVLEISQPCSSESSSPSSGHDVSATTCLYDLIQFLGFLFMLDRFLTSLVQSGERKFAESAASPAARHTNDPRSPRRRAWNRLVQSLKQIKSLKTASAGSGKHSLETDDRTSASSSQLSHDKVDA